MKQYITLLLVSFFGLQASAQTLEEKFDHFWNTNDTLGLRLTLEEWQAADSTNAEYYTSLFNYYFKKASQEVVAISTDEPRTKGEDIFVLKDSTDAVKGYMHNRVNFSPIYMQKAMEAIDKGISQYPDRIDMRFGKTYAYGEIEDWNNYTNTIIETIKRSKQNNNQWTTTHNEPMTGGRDYLLSVVQDYQGKLYDVENDSLLTNMRNIAQTVVDIYPEHAVSWANIALTYIIVNDLDNALPPSLKAESIDPTDIIILNNIAQIYLRKEENAKAIEYLNKIIKYGNDEDKRYARSIIEKIK